MTLEEDHQISQQTAIKAQASVLRGPTDPPLLNLNLGSLLAQRADWYGSKLALVSSAQGVRHTFTSLHARSLLVAKALVRLGIRHGDMVGILAGNCSEYAELFFACGHIGAILAVFNITYTVDELKQALHHSGCEVLFTADTIGHRDNGPALEMLMRITEQRSTPLREVILLKPPRSPRQHRFHLFKQIIHAAEVLDQEKLDVLRANVNVHDVCNLQFTSGTTGLPKAAMLSHHNIINNACFIGDRMELTSTDILCCPPPLFHCFGLVLGLLVTITHGATIVFPDETFNAHSVLTAVVDEQCTALHGVPAMWAAELQLLKNTDNFPCLRTGIAAGSATPRQMLEHLQQKMHLTQLTNTYGMTETSPASFMTSCRDTDEQRLSTVGKILPHTKAKIIDSNGKVVPVGSKGELCVAGYLLQKGYWKAPERTSEVMIRDNDGELWMHTGDEASFDEIGYCRITGRIKDMIIRGGENVFPLEIEERLMQHHSIANASVVGLKDSKFGEVVAAFLQCRSSKRPNDEELRDWVRSKLSRHKAPKHMFWLGDNSVGDTYPLTGSGKVKKHVLRQIGNDILARPVGSKL